VSSKKHTETHFTATEIVRDVVIGMSDGLTVPFALAAGLTGAATNSSIIVTAGVAEIAAGAIAMGLGGYLASRSESDHYDSEERREQREIIEVPEQEMEETRQILKKFGLNASATDPLINDLATRPDDWVNFMMRFELGLERPEASRAATSAFTIALSYIIGGFIPLAPYIVIRNSRDALNYSICETLLALIIFGFLKGKLTGMAPLKSAMQTGIIGSLAGAAAFFIARLVSG
jgi:VIT1/CCC1 family predicted Fe2+/Mn2+ transporter